MWIVIETFWTPTICTDFEGEVLEWDNEKDHSPEDCEAI